MRPERSESAALATWMLPAAASGLPIAPFIEATGMERILSPKSLQRQPASAASISLWPGPQALM
jgi:hypothetical protein